MKLAPTTMLPKSDLPYDLGTTLDHARRVLKVKHLPAEVENEIRQIVPNVQRLLRRYGFAARNGHDRRKKRLEYLLSVSWGYRVISVLHGYPKKAPAISFDQVKDIANGVCPHIPSGEPVHVIELQKPEGGKRPIVIFGKAARANQSMARDMIYMACGFSPYEYARKGRGRERLIENLKNANKNGGVRALGTFDIKDCFPSMGVSAVESVIPISRRIIHNTIFVSGCTPIYKHTDLISEQAVRAGLSQGALSSPIIAGHVIKPCLDKVPAKWLLSYLDDITLGDGSVGKVEALLDTLAEACLSQHPGSPLFEKCRAAFKIGKPADVLGYWPRPNRPAYGGGIRFSPSPKSKRRFYVRMTARLLRLPMQDWSGVQEKMAYAYAASQKNWGGQQGGREMLITAFDNCIAPLFYKAHKEVLTAIASGKTSGEIDALIAENISAHMPKVVLVTENGLVQWDD
jgi:hypothetical protein